MINFKDLDKSKYYVRIIAVGDIINNSRIHYLYDYIQAELLELNEHEYDRLLNDDTVIVLGRESVETCRDLYNTMDFCVLSVWHYKSIVCSVDYSGGPLKPLIRQMSVAKNRSGETLNDMTGKADEMTVNMRDIFISDAAYNLTKIDGVKISNDGTCEIDSVYKDCLCIPEGVRKVTLGGECIIKELILPESCKILKGKNTHTVIGIDKLYLGGTRSVNLANTRIGELHVKDTFKIIPSGGFWQCRIDKIVGKLKLTALDKESFNWTIIDCDVDLRECDIEGYIRLAFRCDHSIYLPKGIDSAYIGTSLKEAIIQFDGHVTQIDYADMIALLSNKFVFKNGVEKPVMDLIKSSYIRENS